MPRFVVRTLLYGVIVVYVVLYFLAAVRNSQERRSKQKIPPDDQGFERLDDLCKSTMCLPMMNRHRYGHKIANMSKYRFTFCPILKSMRTASFVIMRFLNDTKAFLHKFGPDSLRSIHSEMLKGPCAFPFFREYNQSVFEDKDWRHLIIVRDPIKRFISGWLDKCIRVKGLCNACPREDIVCFIFLIRDNFKARQADPNWHVKVKAADALLKGGNLYQIIRELHGGKLSKIDVKSINWSVYAKRTSIEELKTAVNDSLTFGEPIFDHFHPQSWFCELSQFAPHFAVIKYERSEKFYDELLGFFAERGVDSSILAILRDSFEGGGTKHDTHANPLKERVVQQIYGNRTLKLALYGIYHEDYKMFGFEPPAV